MILRLLGWQGIAGLALAAALALLLAIQAGETRHWRRQSGHYEELYRSGEAALAGTVANFRAAAERARAADQAAASRTVAAQSAINERTADAFQTRLAAARARADQLRRQGPSTAADPGPRRTAAVPGISAAPGGVAQAAGENRLLESDRLIATEQAIQLDELIQWIRRQRAIDPNAPLL